jgi:hypothetical protein
MAWTRRMRGKKKRIYNARIFRSRRAYSFAEIAEMLNTHIRTVQRWKREGLKILERKPGRFWSWDRIYKTFLKRGLAAEKGHSNPVSSNAHDVANRREASPIGPKLTSPASLSAESISRCFCGESAKTAVSHSCYSHRTKNSPTCEKSD